MLRSENRRPYAQALMGLSALFVVVWMLMLGHGSMSFASGFLLVMTASLLLTSVRELLAGNKQKREVRNRVSTQDLLDRKDSPAASITETTTRRLKSRTLGNSRKDI